MKRKYILIPLLSGAVVFTACKDKSSTASADAKQVESGVTKAEPLKASVTPEARAAKLGFAKKLPKNIVRYEAIYNGRKAFDQLLKTDLGAFILERLADEDLTMDDLMQDDDFALQVAAYSEEYFSAYGPGTAENFDLGVKFFERLLYFGAKTAVFLGDSYVKDGDDSNAWSTPKLFMEGPLKGAPKEVIQMLADFDMSPVYQGSKVSNKESRDALALQMEQGLALLPMMFDDAVEPITIKRGDAEFKGYKVVGSKLAAKIDDKTVKQMQEVFDIADIESFKKNVASKNLIAVSGVIDDYVVMFLGKSEKDLVFVDKVEDSVCANEKMVFIDPYIDKDILSAGYYEADVVKKAGNMGALGYRMVGSLMRGFRDGLANASSLGDTQDVEVLLESLEKQGDALAKMFTVTDSGFVVYLEDGVKAELYGGAKIPALDLEKTHKLASMGTGENTVFFANWVNDKNYNQKVLEYVDTLGETTYLLTQRVANLDTEDVSIKQMKGVLDMFDGTFRKDTLAMWQAIRGDFSEGLGAESAIVVDVNGVLPKIPNVPEVILKEGKSPRISYVSTVDDRSKLQASWTQINGSLENILKSVGKMTGDEIPMQVPMSSEKDGLKTWFVPVPFQNDDFVPSISVSDQLFFASTSKTFSEGLAAKFKAGGGDARKGAWVHVDFKTLNEYSLQWLNLVAEHVAEVIPMKSAQEDFKANKPMIEKAIKALGSVEDLTIHTWNEGGRSRSSFHLKAK